MADLSERGEKGGEEEVKKLAEYRLFLEEKVRELEEQVELYRGLLKVIDERLKQLSFVPATEVPVAEEVRPLRRQKDGFIMANAYIKQDEIVIIPAQGVTLYITTPPFKSFFLGKVLEEMRRRDEAEVVAGRLQRDKVLRYDVVERDGRIERIHVFNYRERRRLNEIISTATWTFTRMLEKQP